MHFGVISLFPAMFSAITNYGVTGRAVKSGLVSIDLWNPRDFTQNRHRTVDDRPYGGGPGMVMQAQPLSEAIDAALSTCSLAGAPVVCMSPQGKPLTQQILQRLSREKRLILLAGRYEGIDERLMERRIDHEYSIGDYVVSGGELPLMVLLDGLIRLQAGALGDEQSALNDSFSDGLLDFPHYTRPVQWHDTAVPDVLLSGDHAAINRWRAKQALGRTWLRRPDLLKGKRLTAEQQKMLSEYKREESIEDIFSETKER